MTVKKHANAQPVEIHGSDFTEVQLYHLNRIGSALWAIFWAIIILALVVA